jgi:hypothetical protein
MRKLRFVLPLAVASLAGIARADQCAWVSEEQAQAAAKILRAASRASDWCEPCGEHSPKPPRPVTSVEVRPAGDGQFREVVVNGEAVDLAYVFVERSTGSFENLAKVAGCPAEGVSASFREKGALRPPAPKK